MQKESLGKRASLEHVPTASRGLAGKYLLGEF
jgi:hypothetical protein